MSKLLFLLILLLFLNVFGYIYLKNISNERKSFPIAFKENILLYQKKDIVLYDPNDFVFEDYFVFLSFLDPIYRFNVDDVSVTVLFNDASLEYPLQLKEKEIVEKIVYRDKPASVSETVRIPEVPESSSSEAEKPQSTGNSHYLNLHQQRFSFPQGTDINTIVTTLTGAADSDTKITIDFSSVNPNEKGTYAAVFATDYEQKSVRVIIE